VSPAPDDDAERLVLADELLAKGDARGELIVVQCELARGGFSRERGIALRKRELQLLLAHENTWANLDGLARSWTFRRGFVDEITIDVAKFAEHEEEIWKRAPYLRWLRFRGLGYDSAVDDLEDASLEWDKVRPRLERALESTRVRYFSVEDARVSWTRNGEMSYYTMAGPLDDTIARWLTDEPSLLGRLRGIGLSDAERFTLSWFARVDASAGIEELEIEGDLFESWYLAREHFVATKLAPLRARLVNRRQQADEVAIMKELLGGPFGARLTSLDTFHLEPVLSSPCAARLRELRVSPRYDRGVFEALASAPQLASLEELALDVFPGRQLDLEIEPLYDPKHLESLRTIRFGPGISPERVRALLRSRLATRLEMIDLRHSKVTLESHAEELRGLWDGHLLL
jgi:uncharacterized protein (TIGR02996 family)